MVARHRNFDHGYDDQVDDDHPLSDGGEDYISPEHQVLLNDGLDRVRDIIGDAEHSGLSDNAIKDVLWDCHFDIDETVQWAIEEQERIHQAQQRKAPPEVMKDLPPLPPPERELGYGEYTPPVLGIRRVVDEHAELGYGQYSPPVLRQFEAMGEQGSEVDGRSREPLIRPYQSPELDTPVKRNLSTITERTERTEVSPGWPPRQRYLSLEIPRPPSTITTSYGQGIDTGPVDTTINSLDPDLIPVSPSGSALHRLSYYEPAPSMPPSEAGDSYHSEPPKPPSEPVPPLDTIPDIPDLNSKSSRHVPPKAPSQPAKKSKLAMLASSRASTSSARSESTRSTGTSVAGSVKTYPELRPRSQSVRSEGSESAETTPSSMSSHVRRAIETALQLEVGDVSPTPQSPELRTPTPTPATLTQVAPVSPKPASRPTSTASSRPTSKLALLAQANKVARNPTPEALPGAPRLPQERTQYLTPIANGPTVTTAITTSYQSLRSLTNPDRVDHGRFVVVPLPGSTINSPNEPKKSKLAMKVKRAQEKQQPQADPVEPAPLPIPPIFLPTVARTRASPSAFATVLLDDVKSLSSGDSEQRSERRRVTPTKIPDLFAASGSAFDAAREREKAQKLLAQKQIGDNSKSATSSRSASPMGNLVKGSSRKPTAKAPLASQIVDQRELDIAGLNLVNKEPVKNEEVPKVSYARDKLLEEVRSSLELQERGKKPLSIVVIGHVDAGKSTLMGRLLYELGRMDERTKNANERNSSKAGKGSFSWAWGLDGTAEERERGITMDIAQQSFSTPHRQITVLDAPGHKEFIPNMISGAAQADCAILVVDASTGEFESGFERGGQTREHLILARSLGVAQVIVAINKLDTVDWDKSRYDEICALLQPFLSQSGYHHSKTKFVPVGAMQGVNLALCDSEEAKQLSTWYNGPTLVDLLDQLEAPTRDITIPMRFPIANIFKGQGSGTYVSGRLLCGVVQVGEKVRILPGDETGVIKSIEVEEENVAWASAGSNATLSLVAVDPIQLTIGSILCPPTDAVPLALSFTARIIIFDIQVPIITGAMVELFHHSRDVPATISKLVSTLDRSSGKVLKSNPRVLAKASSAEVQITLRPPGGSGPSSVARPIPVEPYAVNKAMGRILVRREGETIAAGVIMAVLS
ncbi:HBS1-like protein [Mycena kentingensis (nom. inval.)]|nr:HBS1-like protein [Mycena kentingensis (nom. inval.)]